MELFLKKILPELVSGRGTARHLPGGGGAIATEQIG
jgi:hypothetical protein